MPASVHRFTGWTIYSNLYQLGKTFIIVTSKPETFPEIRMMTSTSAEIWNGDEAVASREPTEENMRVVSTAHLSCVGPGARD